MTKASAGRGRCMTQNNYPTTASSSRDEDCSRTTMFNWFDKVMHVYVNLLYLYPRRTNIETLQKKNTGPR